MKGFVLRCSLLYLYLLTLKDQQSMYDENEEGPHDRIISNTFFGAIGIALLLFYLLN